MCTGYEADRIIMEEKPQIFLKSITFNDNTSIKLEQNSIIVFTGANNSGKTSAMDALAKFLANRSFVFNDITICTTRICRS